MGPLWISAIDGSATQILACSALKDSNLRTGDLDLSFRPAGTGGFEELSGSAVEFDLEGLFVPVASLEDVVRSKEAADRQKDRVQLPTLKALLDEAGRF